MYNKKLGKVYMGCALAMALAVTATPASVFAAGSNKEVNTVAPDDAGKADDPTSRTQIDPTAASDPDAGGPLEAYSDTDIDVWAFSENTKYSVDVEWGAMTFEYEAEWNATNHQMGAGNWKIYDTSGDGAAIEGTANAINRVTVTNHSNAPVYAKLSYAGETTPIDYSATTGAFSQENASSDTDVNKKADANSTWNAAADSKPGYFTLQSAAKADGSAGTAAVGNIYFMPSGISDAIKTSGIAKWTKIGKITVALQTTDPATP